jgi:hypothetical protein
MDKLTSGQKKDLKVIISFVRVYCRAKHDDQAGVAIEDLDGKETRLCRDCSALVAYALEKRRKCPLDPKPSCKHCHIHCYSKDYRAKIKEIMAFSGRRMIMRGRLDYLWHYFF